jgi:hypothetical protein
VLNFPLTQIVVAFVGNEGNSFSWLVLDQASRTVWTDRLESSWAVSSAKAASMAQRRKPGASKCV